MAMYLQSLLANTLLSIFVSIWRRDIGRYDDISKGSLSFLRIIAMLALYSEGGNSVSIFLDSSMVNPSGPWALLLGN